MTERPVQATIEGRWRDVAAIEGAFARGEIDQATWHARMAALIVPAYLGADNPRGQSGYSGSETDWWLARSLVADAIPRSGTLLDIGCANGLLMESVHQWCAERGLTVEPFGVDIVPELARLAQRRLPHWADHIFVGNAASWIPPRRFDFVRTGLEYVPLGLRSAFLAHLTTNYLTPNGRLLIGSYNEERDETRGVAALEEQVRSWGFNIAGRIERPHAHDPRVVRRLFYVDV